MVRLQSFKYISQEQLQTSPSPPSPPLVRGDEAQQEANSAEDSTTESVLTVVGGNLTSASASELSEPEESAAGQARAQRMNQNAQGNHSMFTLDVESTGTTVSSNEEFQSASYEITEDAIEDEDQGEDEDEIPKISANLKQGKLEDIAKHRKLAASQTEQDNNAVTRINIERGAITNLAAATMAESPVAHRFVMENARLMTRSHTSPSSLVAQAAAMSPASKRFNLSGDNMSQFSFSTQKNYNTHFEIRWQNVRLYARQNTRLPKFVADSSLYQYFARSASEDDPASARACYSPPVQHKIPPTIDEEEGGGGLEMRSSKTRRPEEALFGSVVSLAGVAPQVPSEPPAKGRCILNSISGQVFSGQMTAILGPSGVGKTTLLNSLTGRNTLDGTGRVSLIGATTRKRMSVVTVPQMDVLPGKLTTLEDLLFTSRLKNPQAKFDHKRNVNRLVKHLHMDKFLYTRIDKLSGGEERRLSIARELLSSPDIMILDEPTSGLDANTCKKIISALRDIVEHSDNILDKPMSIIVTIHQPQREVYNLFHRVYVMAQGGRVVYEGPPAMLLPTMLEQSSLARVAPADQLNENPAIVAIEVASGEYGPLIIDELARAHEDQVYEEFSMLGGMFADIPGAVSSPVPTPRTSRAPRKSPLSVSRFELFHHRRRLNSFGDGSIGRPTPVLARRQLGPGAPLQMDRNSSLTSLSYASTYDADLPEVTSRLKVDKRLRRSVVMKSHLLSHTWTLIQRCWLLTIRDIFLMAIRILGFLLVAAGMVQIFSDSLDPNEHQCPRYESQVDDVVDYIGNLRHRLLGLEPMIRQSNSLHMFFFHILLCITMVTSALAGLVFPLQMRMFMREYKNGWYSPASFILSQTLAELPADIIGPLITLVITYPLCNQPTSAYYWREIGYALVLVMCSIICKSQAQIVGAFLMDSVENSVFISCVCVVAPALLSGIPIRISQMVAPLQLLSYGSFLRYGFESLVTLRYGYGMCPCDPELVNGYPIGTSERAVPPQLNNFARGIIDLSQPVGNLTATMPPDDSSLAVLESSIDKPHENIILNFIRLMTHASNLMVHNQDQLGNCDDYRSLYLLSADVPNNILPKWLGIMVLMFVISRMLTYFAVKTVIKLRRS